MKLDQYSELEMHVVKDMIENGYDPLNEDDIQEYWRERLDEI